MQKFTKTIVFLPFLAGFLFSDQLIPDGNYGPPYFYPADPKDRLYKLPWEAGKSVRTHDSYYSEPGSSHHPDYAIDFGTSDGQPLLAARAGKVTRIRFMDTICRIPTSLGNIVGVSRLDSIPDSTRAGGWRKYLTEDSYLHVRHDIPVKLGDYVEQGQIVAYTSCTGQDGGSPHLHFEVNVLYKQHFGCFDQPDSQYCFTSIPSPFVEITNHPNGLTEEGDRTISQNIPIPIAVESRPRKIQAPKAFVNARPNPFQSQTRVFFGLGSLKSVPRTFGVFNSRGEKVADFLPSLKKNPNRSIVWTPLNQAGGVYVVRLTGKSFRLSKRLTFLR